MLDRCAISAEVRVDDTVRDLIFQIVEFRHKELTS